MRQTKYFEAYLDDFNRVSIYMSKQSYEGMSRQFFLRNEQGQVEELLIHSVEPTDRGYNKYTCGCKHDIEIGKEHTILHQFGRETPLKTGYIVKRKEFDEKFAYAGELGAKYSKQSTHFTLWAPTASRVMLKLNGVLVDLNKQKKGSWDATVMGDYHLSVYTYFVKIDGEWVETMDPYGVSSMSNTSYSVVIDPSLLKKEKHKIPTLAKYSDAIIYECSVRDFTSFGNIGVTHPKQYLGFVEESAETIQKNTGFSYLKSLGVTHVQLLPVLDFGSVDENNNNLYYNWGYDAVHGFTLEGSYSSDANDPFARMSEMLTLVNEVHQAGMRVNLDVVFNHVYELETNALQKMVPNYYFQMNEQGNYSNGSWCGNDFDSSTIMGSRYVVDACKRLCQTYGIDGLRFDLMGILDIDTMNKVLSECKKINPDFMVYGEGWNMPTFLAMEKRACILNDHKTIGIAHFSDRFRDVVKGDTAVERVNDKGYCTGDVSQIQVMKDVLTASCTNMYSDPYFASCQHALNYVECHDNATCWDKLKECCKEDTREKRIMRHKMCIAAVLFAQGIPFIHSGQEFARTKYGKHNTYNDSDKINCLDYDRKDRNLDIVEYTKQCIELRKHYDCLRYATNQEIEKHVSFEEINHSVLVMNIKDETYDLKIIFNPTTLIYHYSLDKSYQVIFYNEKIEQKEIVHDLEIQMISVIVLEKAR